MLKLDTRNIFAAIGPDEFEGFVPRLEKAHETLSSASGPGGEMTGWLTLPERMLYGDELKRLLTAARRIRESSEALVVIGVGGSYLGARAVIELMQSPGRKGPEIYFAGAGFSPDSIGNVLDALRNRDFSVNVVSKSGTTLETAIAFRLFKNLLAEKYGEGAAAGRIYATTDPGSGALREMADREGYETFTVPRDVGGRYSVLSAVGLLPMAVYGLDVREVLAGACEAMRLYSRRDMSNIAWQYAAARNLLYEKGRKIELLAYFEPGFRFMSEWWKQLFGESEGKGGRGIFPASAEFTADLHSLGQFIQDGEPILFETALLFESSRKSLSVPGSSSDLDGLNYLAGRDLGFINRQAALATLLAHADGGVPNMILSAERADERTLGGLIYFFELSCAVSGYVRNLNPFDQPGVEAYKRNMLALLGKPGYDDLRRNIENRIR
ncbi:MAG: glucose-6-phosphate isomerase [Oscillospiraceae bacterium]|jgi:glucose-6-phosphate isomerase